MTASIDTTTIPVVRRGRATSDRFAGFRALARKDLAAWGHGFRPWVILIISTLFMTLAAANAALNFPESNPLQRDALIATGLALFIISFGVNFIARWVVSRTGAGSRRKNKAARRLPPSDSTTTFSTDATASPVLAHRAAEKAEEAADR